MNKILLVMMLGLMCFAAPLAWSGEDASPETAEECDPATDESCEAEEEEDLDRGFDPCLINASLPACNSEAKGAEPGAAEEASSQAEDTDDSG